MLPLVTMLLQKLRFLSVRRSLDDASRSGQSAEVTTEDKVAAARAMVEEDARVTVAQLAIIIGISARSVVTILKENSAPAWFAYESTKTRRRIE